MSDEFFIPPPFKPAEALQALHRNLRDLHMLKERGGAYELRGMNVVILTVADATIEARLAKRPALTTEWTEHHLKSSVDVRHFTELVKRQLQRWSED